MTNYKEEMKGKANIFDRYAYICLEIFRHQMFLGLRIGEGSAEEVTKRGLKCFIEELKMLQEQIKELSYEDKKFLIKDANYLDFEKVYFNNLNKKLIEIGKSLNTEYTQEEPYMSEELIKWLIE